MWTNTVLVYLVLKELAGEERRWQFHKPKRHDLFAFEVYIPENLRKGLQKMEWEQEGLR